MAPRELKPLVRPDEVEKHLRDLAELMAERGKRAGEEALSGQKTVRRLRERPDLTDQFIRDARAALEQEVDFTEPTEGDGQIDASEVHREVAKKALARLKLQQLRRIAESITVDPQGKEEDVISRIVEAYGVDSSEIARLVLMNEEPSPERGVSDRLFPLFHTEVDVRAAADLLRLYVGQYIRTGIARWFVFDDVELHTDFAFVSGSFRTYEVDPFVQDDDFFDLHSVEQTLPVRVRISRSTDIIEARSRGTTEARAGATAVMKALRLKPLGFVPIDIHPQGGELMRWEARSVFMVDFLQNELNRDGLSIFNLTSAQFQTGEIPVFDELRPTVKSVRFEGAHLLSSKAACELLVEGRALVSVSALVRFAPSPSDDAVLLPLRISLERDHVVVLTGFGTLRPEVAYQLQREVVTRMLTSLHQPLRDEPDLERLARRIRARARQDDPVETADILAPEAEEA